MLAWRFHAEIANVIYFRALRLSGKADDAECFAFFPPRARNGGRGFEFRSSQPRSKSLKGKAFLKSSDFCRPNPSRQGQRSKFSDKTASLDYLAARSDARRGNGGTRFRYPAPRGQVEHRGIPLAFRYSRPQSPTRPSPGRAPLKIIEKNG
jgi:hypothetical protein